MKEFDLFSDMPRFRNGLVHESVVSVGGAFDGGIRNKVSISITAFNPDIKRLTRLLNERLGVLGLSSVTILLSNNDFTGGNSKASAIKFFERVQDQYTILSYDLDVAQRLSIVTMYICMLSAQSMLYQLNLRQNMIGSSKRSIRNFHLKIL